MRRGKSVRWMAARALPAGAETSLQRKIAPPRLEVLAASTRPKAESTWAARAVLCKNTPSRIFD